MLCVYIMYIAGRRMRNYRNYRQSARVAAVNDYNLSSGRCYALLLPYINMKKLTETIDVATDQSMNDISDDSINNISSRDTLKDQSQDRKPDDICGISIDQSEFRMPVVLGKAKRPRDTMSDQSDIRLSNGMCDQNGISPRFTMSVLSETTESDDVCDIKLLDESRMSDDICGLSVDLSETRTCDSSSTPVTVAPPGAGGGPYLQPESGQRRVTDDLGQPLMFPESYTRQSHDLYLVNCPCRRTDDLGQPLLHPASYTRQQRHN